MAYGKLQNYQSIKNFDKNDCDRRTETRDLDNDSVFLFKYGALKIQ